MIEFWTVENTGWSGGISWFRSGGTDANPLRFESKQKATRFALRNKQFYNDPEMLWRVVHTTIERVENKTITIEEYEEV